VREYAAGTSRVVVGRGALSRLAALAASTQAHRAAIVTDTNVGPHYAGRAAAALAALDPAVVTVPAGETHKTRDTWARVTDDLLAHGLGRDSVIVALGGGVIGDLAGFVAATYMRGVPLVQVPTSLIAMVDAAIGGKTGVDVPAGKNLVGAFHAAQFVVVDPDLLATLPDREFRGGLAEAVKHGAIADAEYFAFVAARAGALHEAQRTNPADVLQVIERSVATKSAVVTRDPSERGERKILNFGHTLGHAIEAASRYELRHGEAIAIGMVLEARLGESLRVTAPGTAAALTAALARAGLPVTTTLDATDLVARTHADKKKLAGRVEYSLPAAIGRFERWTTPVDDDAVLALFA
jgi:3-dehydroquinate synthase